MKILLVSHGEFAKGFCSTLVEFFGATNLYYANVTLDEGTGALREKVDYYLAQWQNEQVVICSDLKGGSANQTVFPYISRDNTFLISGVNFSLVLQLMMENDVDEKKLETMIEMAKEDIVLMNSLVIDAEDDSDEFF